MNSNRIFRAVVTVLTLLGLLWGINQLRGKRTSPGDFAQVDSVISEAKLPPESTPIVPVSAPAALSPIIVKSLPVAAMGNTCFEGTPADLSCWTGMISGGPAREYQLTVRPGRSLKIRVEPGDDDFDPSFALFDSHGKCVLGMDAAGAGYPEKAAADTLHAGSYKLMVGGYGTNCGSYLLTVRDEPAPLARISETQLLQGSNGSVIRWQSFAEMDIATYRLFRITDSGREWVTTLRPHGSPAGFAQYKFFDQGTQKRGPYELEVVSKDGRTEVVTVRNS